MAVGNDDDEGLLELYHVPGLEDRSVIYHSRYGTFTMAFSACFE